MLDGGRYSLEILSNDPVVNDAECAEAVAVSPGNGDVHDFKIIRIADGAELQAQSTSDLEIWRVGSSVFFIKQVVLIAIVCLIQRISRS